MSHFFKAELQNIDFFFENTIVLFCMKNKFFSFKMFSTRPGISRIPGNLYISQEFPKFKWKYFILSPLLTTVIRGEIWSFKKAEIYTTKSNLPPPTPFKTDLKN